MRSLALSLAVLLSLGAWTAPAPAQALNIDFGKAGLLETKTPPPPDYAAAGLAGTWNVVPVLTSGQRWPLVGLDGAPVAAQVYGVGGVSMLVNDDPATLGADQALLDDMLIGFNNPVDVCIWIEWLEEGEYEILTYALTPGNAALQCSVRVDDGTPGGTMIGGAWGGTHAEGLSFARHRAHTVNGTLGLHSGKYGGLIQSGINGIQIYPVTAVDAGRTPDGLSIAGPRVRAAYPNPAAGSQTLEIEVPCCADVELDVVDIRGRVAFRQPLPWTGESLRRVLWPGRDLGSGGRLPAGIYLARVARPGEAATGPAFKLIRAQ